MNVDANVSSRINLMRIVLISGIVFVHIPFDPANTPFNGTYGFFDWLRVFLSEALFRVGVPCLSAISGYLLFRGGMEGFNYTKTVRTKAQTVFLPFLIWNTLFFAAVVAILAVGIGDGYVTSPYGASVRELLSQLFAIEHFPTNVPLYFLRDLFVCILISPVLAWLLRREPLPTLAVLLFIALLPGLNIYLVIKNSILFSFAFGIYVSLHRIDIKALDRFAPLGIFLLFASSALLATAIYETGPSLPIGVQLFRNALAIAGTAGFWVLSSSLIKTSFGQMLSKTGSLSFWIFCAHNPLLVFLFMVWGKTGVDFYPLFFCGCLLVLFPLLVLSNGVVRSNAPKSYALLTGGRTKKGPQPPSRRPMPAEFASQQR